LAGQGIVEFCQSFNFFPETLGFHGQRIGIFRQRIILCGQSCDLTFEFPAVNFCILLGQTQFRILLLRLIELGLQGFVLLGGDTARQQQSATHGNQGRTQQKPWAGDVQRGKGHQHAGERL